MWPRYWWLFRGGLPTTQKLKKLRLSKNLAIAWITTKWKFLLLFGLKIKKNTLFFDCHVLNISHFVIFAWKLMFVFRALAILLPNLNLFDFCVSGNPPQKKVIHSVATFIFRSLGICYFANTFRCAKCELLVQCCKNNLLLLLPLFISIVIYTCLGFKKLNLFNINSYFPYDTSLLLIGKFIYTF